MKNLMCYLAFALTIYCCSPPNGKTGTDEPEAYENNKNNSLHQMGLKGSVRHIWEIISIAESQYGDIVPGAMVKDGEHSYLFDKEGYMTERILCGKYDGFTEKMTYKFNERGYPSEIEIIDITNKQSIDAFGYNEKGYLVERKLFTPDVERWTYKYDDKGRKTEMITYNLPNNDKMLTRYDANGNESELIIYWAGGELKEKYICEYEFDEKGNWTKQIKYTAHIPDIPLIPAFITIREIEYWE